MKENTKEVQLSFLPEGWVNIDVAGNRLSLFLRNYPFEEKFADISKKFEERRYEERKVEAAVRKIKRSGEARHFDFYEDVELVNELHIGGRESAAGRKAFDFFGLLKLFLACISN